MQDFVDELSNWYVRRCRQRFWGKELTQDKINAYKTLYTALVTTAKTAAPMIPFMAESIYQNLVCSVDQNAPESVHLCDYPEVKPEWIDKELENEMENVLEIVALGRAARNDAAIKNRQPIAKMFVQSDKGESGKLYQEIIAEELNVKEVLFVQDAAMFSDYIFKPQLKLLGRKFGKQIGEVREALSALEGQKAKKELDSTGKIKITLSTGETELAAEELIIETAKAEGYASVSDRGVTVVLDTVLTEDLLEEGFVREVISKIQSMRRDADFDVMDNIEVYACGSSKVLEIMQKNQAQIKDEVLAKELVFTDVFANKIEWDINGESVALGVKKV